MQNELRCYRKTTRLTRAMKSRSTMSRVLVLCLVTTTLCQDTSTQDNLYDQYDENRISDPYDIPILAEDIVRTEPLQQQEVLPLLSKNINENEGVIEPPSDAFENVGDEGETSPEDMYRVSSGESNIVMKIDESLGDDFSQLTSPRELPVMGKVGTDISLELVFPDGFSIFRLEDKMLHLIEPLDRDQSERSSIVFQVSFILFLSPIQSRGKTSSNQE